MVENEDDIELKESLIWTQRANKLEQLFWKLQRRTIGREHQGWAALLAEQVVIKWSLVASQNSSLSIIPEPNRSSVFISPRKYEGNSGDIHEDSVSGVELPVDSYLVPCINEGS